MLKLRSFVKRLFGFVGVDPARKMKDKLKAEIDIDARFLSLIKELCECSFVKHVHLKIYGDTDPVVFEIKNDTIPNVRGLIMPIRTDRDSYDD